MNKLILAHQLIIKDFQLDHEHIEHPGLEDLRRWLSNEISVMIDRNFSEFLNILYRIDVSEEKVKKAFAGEDPTFEIADLIIERELRKVETRLKYGSA